MLAALVRIALLAYPNAFRTRYGDELKQLTIEVMAGRRTVPGRLVVLFGVVGHGAAARVRAAESARSRVAVTSVSVLVATVVVATNVPSDEVFVQNAALSPSVRLGAAVSVVSSKRTTARGSDHPTIVVRVPAGVDPRISVAGAPAAVVIDPKSVEVLSIDGRPTSHRR